MPDDATDDELLKTLRAPPEKPALPETRPDEIARRNDAIVRAFLFGYLGLKIPTNRGGRGTPSIQACSLYRAYREWARLAIDSEPMPPRSFCHALRRNGVKKRRMYQQEEQAFRLLFCQEGSKRLIKWLEENPDPYGWPVEFGKLASNPEKLK